MTNSNRESVASVAARGIRSIRPSDVDASVALQGSDPATYLTLRDAVLAGVRGVPAADQHDVTAVALLTVARHYSVLGSTAHAVARAVSLARQAVTAAGSEAPDVLVDWTDADERTRLEAWQATRPDSIAATNDQREAFRALLARVAGEHGDDVLAAWEAIAGAWLAHDSRACARCGQGTRLSVETIRLHVSGRTAATDRAARRMAEQDRATVALVREALAPMVASRPGGPVAWDAGRGDVWAVFGVAWAMVEHGDRREAFRPSGRTDVLAWEVARGMTTDTAAGVDVLVDSLGYPSALGYGATAGVWSVGAGRVVARQTMAATPARVFSHAGEARPAPAADVLALVDGRPMTEAEAATAARPTTRRERTAPHAGEGDDTASTARDLTMVSAATGQVRSGKVPVSPRKRGGGQTGPTIPGGLSGRGVAPVEHDATRAARYDARILAGRRAVLAAQGADLPADD